MLHHSLLHLAIYLFSCGYTGSITYYFFLWLHFVCLFEPLSLGNTFSLELWLHLRHLGALLPVSRPF